MSEPQPRNATDLVVQRVAQAPDHVAFEVPLPGGGWRPITTKQFDLEVRELAKGMIAVGLQPGDAVAIMAATRYEWAVADLATWYAGAIVVPIYDTSAQPQVDAIVHDADVRLGIAGSAEQAALLENSLAGRDSLGIWTMDAARGTDLADLRGRSAEVADETVEARRRSADANTVATIVYTSGTTASPKGALITHGDFVGKIESVTTAYTEVVREDGNTIIFLPLAHVLARGLQLLCIARGMRVAHVSDPREVIAALAVLRPTFLVVVPRVLQKIQAAAQAKAQAKRLGGVWQRAVDTAVEWGRFAEDADAGLPVRPTAGLRARRRIFDVLFLRRLRAVMGGRIDYLLSGAAPLDASLSLFFRGMGVPVIEGYGLTETTAPLTGNLPGAIRSGTVGVPLPGVEVRISDAGEVLARGSGVFSGYRNPADNAEAFVDGWFRTGDLGELDEGGRLTLKGRIKDIIVTAGGKNISPHDWETQVEADPLVAHAVMVGEGKPYLGGLILLDPESVQQWVAREGLADQSWAQLPLGGAIERIEDSRLVAAIEAVVARANERFSKAERVRSFALLFTDLNANQWILTPTQKLKRSALAEKVSQVIDAIYTPIAHASAQPEAAPGRGTTETGSA